MTAHVSENLRIETRLGFPACTAVTATRSTLYCWQMKVSVLILSSTILLCHAGAVRRVLETLLGCREAGQQVDRVIEQAQLFINGTYNYGSSENFDAYLKELGVGWLLRRAAGLARPTISVTR